MKMQIDINSCRVCLENIGVIPIFQNHGGEIASNMISSLFNIDVIYDENLPTYICTNCLENIKLCILTKNIIVNSESMLSKYLKSNITIEESTENVNHIKVQDEDPIVIQELGRLLDAEEIKIERFADSSQDFEDEPFPSLQIIPVQSLTSFNSETEGIQEEIQSGTVLDQEPKHDPAELGIHPTHVGENQFECVFCDKGFPSSCSLRAHKDQIHFNMLGARTKKVVKEKITKPNKCHSCKHNFATPYSLKLHMIIHTGVKEQECPHCGKKFALKGYLKRHMQLIHSRNKK